MARTRTPPATRRRSGGGFMLGVFVGLLVGLAIALGIAFYLNKTPIPFLTSAKQHETEKSDAKTASIAGMPQGTTTTAPEKPKFDFYKILPGNEEPVTEKQLQASVKRGQQGSDKDVYFIQAGSFQNPAEADNQKARLAILGFDSTVEPTTLPDKGTWYRVRMGPYTKVEDINRVRQLLAQNGINANLVKIKEPQ